MLLSDTLLQAYIDGFYGYGNYAGKYWFVGMEEGGGNSVEEIEKRLQVWQSRGKKELEDVAGFHRDVGRDECFTENAKIQPTWAKLIRLILAAEGKDSPDRESLLRYQTSVLGKTGENNCIIELLPLPSPSTSHWIYRDCTKIDYLKTRADYREAILPRRITQLQQKLKDYTSTPKIVVFYSLGYMPKWKQVVTSSFQPTDIPNLCVATEGKSVFAITPHPIAHGVTNADFEKTGRLLADRLNQIC